MRQSSALTSVLRGEVPWRRPLWLMRQAGRYLEEYRAVRAQAGSFLDLCLDPVLASEVTMQPLRRFDLDAAIVFADILLVPLALGMRLEFRENEGPVLDAIDGESGLRRLHRDIDMDLLAPVLETLRTVRGRLEPHQSLIGFCGAPWTVASYMIEGRSTPDRMTARQAALQREPWFGELMDRIVDGSVAYLCGQVRAGADVLQIFDSWAGDLPEFLHEDMVFMPIRRIIDGVRREAGHVPIIGFARGLGAAQVTFAQRCEVQAVSVESSAPVEWLRDSLMPHVAVQGNLDPLALLAGGQTLEKATRRLLSVLPAHGHIMNLGHGVLPATPVANVEAFVGMVRAADAGANG